MADIDVLKQLVVKTAREQVTSGAHYLWSTAGNTPGQKDGAKYRPGAAMLHPDVPDLNQPSSQPIPKAPFSPMAFAAWADTGDGKLVCAGKLLTPDVASRPLALGIPVHDALKLTLKTIKPDQIDELKKNSAHPEQFRWPRQNSTLDHPPPADAATIWGDSCIGKRHFDCIGLVNYCMSLALHKIWQYGVENFANPDYAKKAGFTQIDFTQAQACDIVTIDKFHIGIVAFEGTVIEAKDINEGVVENKLDAKYWKQCYRIPAGEWKPGP
jgi:hypothetical protein